MRSVYAAPNPMVAHLFQAFLDERGIDSIVEGELLYPLRGELPMNLSASPQVSVVHDGDFERALELVAEFESAQSRPEAQEPPWRCPQCGETIPAQFTACWKCGHDRLDSEDAPSEADSPSPV